VLSISYVRSAFLDILQMQGDMIVGAETLPIVLGEKRTIRLLKMIIVSTALLLLISPVLNLVSPFAFLLLLCLIPLAICLQIYDEKRIYQGPRIEYLAEGGFILAGIMALIWQGVT
jgi:4-hydroxy-3-methylbut-2-enyl diphosphate reductase